MIPFNASMRSLSWWGRRAVGCGGVLMWLGSAGAVVVQGQSSCTWFCAPEVKVEPQITLENLFSAARMEELQNGTVVAQTSQEREPVFELALVVGIPTEIPRVGFTFETIFGPFGEVGTHPFTGALAAEGGRSSLRDNSLEVEFELNLSLLEPEQVGGWVESHFDIVDKLSPGAHAAAGSVYTHKLNFELDTAVLLFHRLPEDKWLHHLEVEASLDYLATGLPRAGDIVGSLRYLDDASPWSLSLVAVVPLAPLMP